MRTIVGDARTNVLGAALVALGTYVPTLSAAAAVDVVPTVDLDRYVGRWYEIASIPQFFQRKCVGDVSAEYERLPDGLIKVTNRCRRANGSFTHAEGRAKVVDPAAPAKLKVTFVNVVRWLFWLGGDYWIVDLDRDYRYAVIGHPRRTYAWILSRTPTLPAADLARIHGRLEHLGYDTCRLMTTVQPGGPRTRRSFCRRP